MRKTKAEAQKTKEQLLQSALDTFYQLGVSNTSLHNIACNAGVTRGALYWHFKNKEDLFEALFQQTIQSLNFSLDDLSNAKDINEPPANLLQQLLIQVFNHLQYDDLHRKLCIIVHRKCEYNKDTQSLLAIHNKYVALWEDRFKQAIELCIKKKQLPSNLDTSLAMTYLSVSIGGLIQLWIRQPEVDLMKTALPIIDAIIFTLKNNPGMKQPILNQV